MAEVQGFANRVVVDPATGASRLLKDVQAEGVFLQDLSPEVVASQVAVHGDDVLADYLTAVQAEDSADGVAAASDEAPAKAGKASAAKEK